MDPLTLGILFLFGIAIGSFLNVVILRYDGDHFLFDTKMLGGRSHCMHCHATLRWFELIPVLSFILQGGRCRRCKVWLNFQYPIVELISGLIFMFVPVVLIAGAGTDAPIALAATLWIAALEALLVMAMIDVRLGIIPDEINIFLAGIGVLLMVVFGWNEGAVLSRLIGGVVAGACFAALIAITRGKGMGMGDLKLVIPLGLMFGWPDILFVLMFAFIIGAIVGVLAVVWGKNTMKGTLPFGPFLALGAATMFFWGAPIVSWYFSLLGIR